MLPTAGGRALAMRLLDQGMFHGGGWMSTVARLGGSGHDPTAHTVTSETTSGWTRRFGEAFVLHMASSQPNGVQTPFQDLTNSDNIGQRADLKELKRQRERDRYARNRDEINKKRREAWALKKSSAILNEELTPTNIPVAITPMQSGFNPMYNATGHSAVTQLRCTQATEGIPTVAVIVGGTPTHGQNSFQLNQSVTCDKENLNYYGIDHSHSPVLQTRSKALSSLGNHDQLPFRASILTWSAICCIVKGSVERDDMDFGQAKQGG